MNGTEKGNGKALMQVNGSITEDQGNETEGGWGEMLDCSHEQSVDGLHADVHNGIAALLRALMQ